MQEFDLLVRRVRSGEIEAYAEIVRACEQTVWRVVAAMLQDFEQSRDVMQQVFVDAYVHLDQYQLGRDFPAWIKTIARNRVRQELRRLMRETRRLGVYREQLLQANFEQSDRHEADFFDALTACRQKLPDRSQQVLHWRYHEGKSFDEIARLLGGTKAAAEKLLSRVRSALRECIESRLAEA